VLVRLALCFVLAGSPVTAIAVTAKPRELLQQAATLVLVLVPVPGVPVLAVVAAVVGVLVAAMVLAKAVLVDVVLAQTARMVLVVRAQWESFVAQPWCGAKPQLRRV